MTDLLADVRAEAFTPAAEGGSGAHGGQLVDLLAAPGRVAELTARSVIWPSWQLTRRQLCDLELLAAGGFSPLRGFLGEDDHRAVCESMRLADGTLWPVPVTLDLPDEVVAAAGAAGTVALRDPEGLLLAALHVTEAWRPDLMAEAEAVLGTTDPAHPGVEHLLRWTNRWYVAGKLEVLRLPQHADFRQLRHTPLQLRAEFARRGWTRVVAFQTRNPMHRAHQELTLRAAREARAKLLIHPVVGVTKPGDVDPDVRVRCYSALLPTYPAGSAMVSLLPLAMRMAGPREALWHAIVRKNYGATHFIVGRDHAGPGLNSHGRRFYRPYDAQDLLDRHRDELAMTILPFQQMVYVEREGSYVPEGEVRPGAKVLTLSGTQLRARLAEGREIPPWFTPPEVAAELRRSIRPRAQQGFTVFFTGLSGSGKSTIGKVLAAALRERSGRRVTLLDGNVARQHLSRELGYSREHRDLNVLRIGFVAAQVTGSGGIAVCTPTAPYDSARRDVRRMVGLGGGFVLVHVATPLDVCEQRDPKGHYAKARLGLMPGFTGISDPYEEPTDAEIVLDTRTRSAEQEAQRILQYLEEQGYLPAPGAIHLQ